MEGFIENTPSDNRDNIWRAQCSLIYMDMLLDIIQVTSITAGVRQLWMLWCDVELFRPN